MNSDQLNAIKERAEKATPGPWVIEESRYGSYNAVSVDTNYDFPACLMKLDNALFVTKAREDIPQLVAEVDRLQSELESAVEHADYRIKYSGQLSTELATSYDEIDRLKSAITYACEMFSIGESRKANDKLTEALGVPHDYFEEESE